ncbi:uncharacterized protein RCC_12243 [Ramularia collo-cygni]|uniref:Hydantoin racemase n=1 Tax=Ramularia collo-cygni TaxID=112498 RepID=A0A2D3UR10_9PEZI|nr:uncharacterized protein RCC_12243 [Ramularia collo-cygni]CZT14760.1 uncharacterized protein RCC_12243 [Ramularia collo-cygni]
MNEQQGLQTSAMPSSRPISILLVNPNATESMTNSCLSTLTPFLPSDVHVTPFTAPAGDAPTAIESTTDSILASAACFRAILPLQKQHSFDAILVACYSDIPLIKMLREEFTIPVIGIMEASLLYARTLGGRFGLIATSARSKIIHRDAVRAYGCESFCAGIESCNLGVLELESRPSEEVVAILRDVARKLIADGAEVLTLGCAGMSMLKTAVEAAVETEQVQCVDGVVAGIQHLTGCVRMGGKTSKVGGWRSSAEGRKRRGQEYV